MLGVSVSIPDGLLIPIELLLVDTGREALGVFTCPSGDALSQIKSMQDKAQDWIDLAKEVKLHQHDIWFLMDHQLWSKVVYGLCSLAASRK